MLPESTLSQRINCSEGTNYSVWPFCKNQLELHTALLTGYFSKGQRCMSADKEIETPSQQVTSLKA